MIKTLRFIHQGQHHDVRAKFDGDTFVVRAFRDGKPANGYEYSVRLPVAFDLARAHGADALTILMEDAKSDVVEGTWERLLAALENIRTHGST